jgi:class 3 adenylate cyclase
MDKTLNELFKKEYNNIPLLEKKFLFNKTMVYIADDLRKKIRDDFFLSNKLMEEKKFLSKAEVSLISHHYTGSSRYSWHGYDKTLLYFLDKKNNGEYRLFFSSLSDVADKTNFIESTFLYLFLLISSNFLLSYFNHYINLKKQIKVNEKISSLYKQAEQKNTELKALSGKLAKFLDPQIYKSIFSGEKEIKIETYRKMLTVFFVDIKDFTELTENLEPEPLTKLLNDYFNEMSKIANKYGGTVDKFMGDGILIFFGDPNTKGQKQDALNCILMSLEMRDEISVLQKKWYNQGIPRLLKIRMGIHTGYCTVGNFGSENRLDYTIIGGTVNISSRLESMAELDQILISHTTYALINDEVDCDEKGIIDVRGIAYPIKTYLVKKPFSLNDKNQLKSHFSKNVQGFSLSLNLNDVNKKVVEDYLKEVLKKIK